MFKNGLTKAEALRVAYDWVNSKEYRAMVYQMFSTPDSPGYEHGFYRHINYTDDELIARLNSEPISAATCFDITKENACEIFINALLDLDDEEPLNIAKWWLSEDTEGEYYQLHIYTDKKIGHGFMKDHAHKWRDGSLDCTNILFVLNKLGEFGMFYVVTCYPVF